MSDNASDTHTGQEGGRLEKAFRSSMFWNFANMSVAQIVSMVTFIFLTYKLPPATFGLFALGVIAVDYFYYQARSGAVDAIIQRRRYDRTALNSAFWISMLAIVIVTVILYFSGGLAASAMSEPALQYVLPALALTLLPVPFSIAPNALLLRDHDFRGIAIRGIIAALAGAVIALITAYSAYPEWALVTQRATMVLVSTLFLMLRARWIPGLSVENEYAMGFSVDTARIFAAQSVGVSYMRILEVLIALFQGTAALGLMRAGNRMVEAIYGAFAAPIGSLWIILLSEDKTTAQDRPKIFLRLSQMSALICLPVFAGIALTAQDIVDLLLAEKFDRAGPALAIMAAAGMFVPLAYFRNHALTALRRLNMLLGFSVLDVVIIFAAGLMLAPISLEAAVASILIMFLARALFTVPILVKEMHTGLPALLSAVMPAYLGCAAMTAGVFILSPLLTDAGPFIRLASKAGLGAAIYAVYILLIHRGWAMIALSMIWSKSKTAPAN